MHFQYNMYLSTALHTYINIYKYNIYTHTSDQNNFRTAQLEALPMGLSHGGVIPHPIQINGKFLTVCEIAPTREYNSQQDNCYSLEDKSSNFAQVVK